MGVVVVVLIISFLVLIHELGHFLAAWWAKVRIFEFGLGYPPLAKKLFTWRGVKFSLNWIPFGGFVQMAGEDSDEEDSQGKKLPKEPAQPGFEPLYKRPWWKKLIVISAGAAINMLFGVFIFILLSVWFGIPQLLETARIAQVQEGTPAQQAGIPSNVEVLELQVGNERLEKPSVIAMQDFIKLHAGQELTLIHSGVCKDLTCEKNLITKKVRIRTPQETPAGQGALGVMFQEVIFLKYTWYELPIRATHFAFSQSFEMVGLIWKALGDMLQNIFFKGNVPSELSGPIGIAYDFQQNNLVNEGLPSILGFMAALSINLGVMNMLPIPALDGGRALFVILEEIFGKKRTSKIEHFAHLGGYVFLLTLIVLISARDVWRIITDLIL